MQAPTVVRTYKLKRTRPKEPLGLVLMSGAKVGLAAWLNRMIVITNVEP